MKFKLELEKEGGSTNCYQQTKEYRFYDEKDPWDDSDFWGSGRAVSIPPNFATEATPFSATQIRQELPYAAIRSEYLVPSQTRPNSRPQNHEHWQRNGISDQEADRRRQMELYHEMERKTRSRRSTYFER